MRLQISVNQNVIPMDVPGGTQDDRCKAPAASVILSLHGQYGAKSMEISQNHNF
jgi:hypothetical protein